MTTEQKIIKTKVGVLELSANLCSLTARGLAREP